LVVDVPADAPDSGPLIGGVVGGVVGLLLIVGVGAWLLQRRRREAAPSSAAPAGSIYGSLPGAVQYDDVSQVRTSNSHYESATSPLS